MSTDQAYYLAQINVARMKAPIDSPIMAEFADALDDINALAEKSPGFVWRLKSDTGNATDIRVYEDPKILVNMSVWRSAPQLKAYVYGSLHNDFFVRRRQWFERFKGSHFGMWWVRAGHYPTGLEGRQKLEHLTQNGESPECFTFKQVHPAPTPSRETVAQ
ncbi:MAG: DUF3291 domain-containing protein [Cyanobacteria bacterium J06623_5]